MKIRPARLEDHETIDGLVTAAFGRTEEARIVRDVRADGAVIVELIAEDAGELIGQVLFSWMGGDPDRLFAGLGPLAVRPDHQGKGVGAALARAGIARCRRRGVEAIVVLGHPAYYPRFGFSTEAARLIQSRYAGSPAIMAIALRPGALDAPTHLAFPAAFDRP